MFCTKLLMIIEYLFWLFEGHIVMKLHHFAKYLELIKDYYPLLQGRQYI